MSFFQSRSGNPINGKEENAFAQSSFRNLPDNTQARAAIKRFTLQDYKGDLSYQIVWHLLDGDFKGAEVKQSIRPFEDDAVKADRALNMMFRVFTIGGLRTDFIDMPNNDDLAPLRGCIMSIKIGNGIIQGEERTWVREVWREGDLETCTGETRVRNEPPAQPHHDMNTPPLSSYASDSALTRNASRAVTVPDDSLPF